MDRQEIIRMAADAGITSWVYHQWVKDKFIHIDEGLDGDLACLMQFANLVAAAERQRQQLTDEDISVLWHQSGGQPFKFARMLLK